jgi:hypothetical protein
VSSNPSKGPLIDAEPARRHARHLMAAGVSIQAIATAAGVGVATVSGILYRRGPERPRQEKLRTENAHRILSVRAENVATRYVDPTGTRRRIQALMANGWPQLRLGTYCDLHPRYVTELLRHPSIFGTTAAAVAATYDQLWNKDPRQHGVAVGNYKWVRGYARRNAWAPPGAWDDDTIDDPQAHPEWTGECGTDRGYWVHKRQQLPVCARCETAHAEWLAERAHLSPQDLNRECFRARTAAASREADLATDARELMRFDVDLDLAAERLGVTKQHLQQALIRHPETEATAKAGLERAA